MRTLDEIAAEATQADVRLLLNVHALDRAAGANVDGLFHTPLLALTILVVARGKKSGLQTSDMATWALGTLSKHFETLRMARGRLQWSILLRRRCADGLLFLERMELVGVHEAPTRTIHPTLKGREFLRKLALRADETGVLVRQLDRDYRAVDQYGLELL